MLNDCKNYQIHKIQNTKKTMKNFKNHKKLMPFKCPNFYRTNCNLLEYFYIILILTKIISCSEISLRSFSPMLPYAAISEFKTYLSTYKSDNNSKINVTQIQQEEKNSGRLIAFKNNTIFNSQQLIEHFKTTSAISSKKRKKFGKPTNFHKLQKIVMQGLGLQSLPNVAMMNISQQEYLTKYREYLDLVQERKKRELKAQYSSDDLKNIDDLILPTISTYMQNLTETRQYSRRRRKRSTLSNNVVYMRFPLKIDATNLSNSNENNAQNDIDEANLRLLLITNRDHHHQHGRRNHFRHSDDKIGDILILKVYQLIEPYGRIWLDSKEIDIGLSNSSTTSRWLEFDVTKAVKGWISGRQANLGLEIHCDNCHSHGSHIVEDLSINTDPDLSPVLNIIGTYGTHREKRSRQHHHFMQNGRRKPRKTDCYKENQKCCRHTMEVVFKEIKGFEFIIQPKVFDAGYCRGKCPPRYNPAHHHAFLQSLIWKQDRNKAPRPCCAPSKLVELEVLHVDENDNKKLKVSTWTDMRVLECACS